MTRLASELVGKKNDLEAYLGGHAKKLFLMLEGNLLYQTDILIVISDCCLDSVVVLAEFCQNFEEETGRLEVNLDPINSPVKDEAKGMVGENLDDCLYLSAHS